MAFQLADLRRVLRESAGADEGVDLDGEILDTAFEKLGYDSIALMEAAGGSPAITAPRSRTTR